MRTLFFQIVTIWMAMITTSVHAEVTPTFFYKNSSISLNYADKNISTDAWVTNIGYNYQILPKVDIDFGYLDLTIEHALAHPDEPNANILHGMFGAAKYVHTVGQRGQLYASGGINYIATTPNNLHYVPSSDATDTAISPYVSIGASIPSKIDQNLNLNVELSYQNLQQNTPSTLLSVGAQYRF